MLVSRMVSVMASSLQRQVIEKLRQLDKQQKKARAGPATDEGSNALFDSVLSDCRHFFNRLLINHYV